jgi:hypothetical protein
MKPVGCSLQLRTIVCRRSRGNMDPEFRFVEEPEVQFVDRRRKVWVECDGEPYDFRAVRVLETRHVVHGVALVSFACLRCGKKTPVTVVSLTYDKHCRGPFSRRACRTDTVLGLLSAQLVPVAIVAQISMKRPFWTDAIPSSSARASMYVFSHPARFARWVVGSIRAVRGAARPQAKTLEAHVCHASRSLSS